MVQKPKSNKAPLKYNGIIPMNQIIMIIKGERIFAKDENLNSY